MKAEKLLRRQVVGIQLQWYSIAENAPSLLKDLEYLVAVRHRKHSTCMCVGIGKFSHSNGIWDVYLNGRHADPIKWEFIAWCYMPKVAAVISSIEQQRINRQLKPPPLPLVVNDRRV